MSASVGSGETQTPEEWLRALRVARHIVYDVVTHLARDLRPSVNDIVTFTDLLQRQDSSLTARERLNFLTRIRHAADELGQNMASAASTVEDDALADLVRPGGAPSDRTEGAVAVRTPPKHPPLRVVTLASRRARE